jgi:hypothetical protein
VLLQQIKHRHTKQLVQQTAKSKQLLKMVPLQQHLMLLNQFSLITSQVLLLTLLHAEKALTTVSRFSDMELNKQTEHSQQSITILLETPGAPAGATTDMYALHRQLTQHQVVCA